MFQFDCHAHVYETVTAISQARYVPKAPAPLCAWKEKLDRQELAGGVIVQVSFLGTDNTELCNALKELNPEKFAGVAVVPLDVTGQELDRLVRTGVRGVRWNLVGSSNMPNPDSVPTRKFFDMLRARGLHLELHLEGPRLASQLPVWADQGLDLVIDHFGLPSEPLPREDPMIKAVKSLKDRSNLFFKFSAPYRTPFNVRPHGEELLNLLKDGHVAWGSDWPHTQYEDREVELQVETFAAHWSAVGDQTTVRKLYGLCPD
ncbi:MAG: amidohydrolase family protein [Pseudomonadota bacterium]